MCLVSDNEHSSPILAESQPHTMHEDRAILDTVFATNRNAIMDLHNLPHPPETSVRAAAEDHQPRDGSNSNTEIPPIPDVLPGAPRTTPTASNTTPRRSFSRRGMRLGVHMSILDMGAHSAPEALKKKWIQTSRSNHPVKPTMTGAGAPGKTHVRFPLEDSSTKTNVSPHKKTTSDVTHGRKTSHGWISSPTAEKLHKMIDHLEISPSNALSKLVPNVRRRSSVSKPAISEAQAEQPKRRHSSASKKNAQASS